MAAQVQGRPSRRWEVRVTWDIIIIIMTIIIIILTAAVSMRQGSTANLNTIPDSWTRMEGFSPRQALEGC